MTGSLHVLVVEDDSEKARAIAKSVRGVEGGIQPLITDARTATEALRVMSEKCFDLLILDIAIPRRIEEEPNPEGGIEVFEELLERDKYYVPNFIVGITAFEEVFDVAARRFRQELWHVLLYTRESNQWSVELGRFVAHAAYVKATSWPEHDGYKSDLAIITALDEPELREVRRLPWNWEPRQDAGDSTLYFCGNFVDSEGDSRRVVAASASRMGIASTAAVTAKVIEKFRPRFVVMCGICAGRRGAVEIGDVIAVDASWNYESGKWKDRDGEEEFLAEPHQVHIDGSVRSRLTFLAGCRSELVGILDEWQGAAVSRNFSLNVGPMVSGSAVVQWSGKWEEILRQHRKVLGIEMEVYGLYVICEEASEPRPSKFALKSVADFADEEKADGGQVYAAFTSAQTVRMFAESYLFGSLRTGR